jgi:hypothetical protein
MNAMYENFVGIYDGVFSDEFCDNLIQYFEWCQVNNRTYKRPDNESVKKDDSANLNPYQVEDINFLYPNIRGFLSEFNDKFWNTCYQDYMDKFSVLKDYGEQTVYTYKIQKTQPSGGYHVWHCEDGCLDFANRIGVYVLYLNDVEEGGETEFLYFSKRISPRKGRLMIFPPNYPWTHRGNPPLSGTKYIMTGWLEFR